MFVKGPFTTRITSEYLLITQIACIPNTSRLTRRDAPPEVTPEPTALYVRGAKPQTFTPILKKKVIAIPKLVDQLKRQALTNATGTPLVLTGEAFHLIEQLFTVLYAIGVVNSGADLGETCLQLQSANAILDLARVGLNATQAAAIVCAASLPDSNLGSFNQTLIASAAAGLYGVQLAANFTGTVNTNKLCTQLDLSPLPALGVDINAVKSFVCSANEGSSTNGTSTNTTSTTVDTASEATNVPSIGTSTPYPYTNSSGGAYTWIGTIAVTGSIGTAVTASRGTGIPASGTGFYPTGNLTRFDATALSGTAVFSTGNLPAATGNAGTGTGFNGMGDASLGTGLAGSGAGLSAAGNAPAGYATSSTDSWSSQEGYGQGTADRVPHGPTSTPKYYPKYF